MGSDSLPPADASPPVGSEVLMDGEVLGAPKKSKTRSAIMFVVGLALLVGGGYFVYQSTDGLEGVWDSVRTAPWWMIALIIISPMGNHLSVSMCLHALQSRHGKVGIFEMFILIGSAWMFNYLPMRAGLLGRIGYHKSINKIRIRDSLESSIWSGVLAGISNIILLGVAMLMTWIDASWSILLLAAPVLLIFVLSVFMPTRKTTLLMRALAYRQIDVIVWLGRYWLIFEILGPEMDIGYIAIISAASQIASLMPLTGSGVGFREWAVGLTASVGGHAMETAMTGDIINRAAETLIVVPVGLVCTAVVAKWWKERGGEKSVAELSEDETRADADDQNQSRHAGEQDPSVG